MAAVDAVVDHHLLNRRWRWKLHREPRAGFRVGVAHVVQNIIDAVVRIVVLVRGAEVGIVSRELRESIERWYGGWWGRRRRRRWWWRRRR